jgi:hypothetical protein
MRTAARVALVLTGTAIFVAAMAMPVAHAGDGLIVGMNMGITARAIVADMPRSQAAPCPEKLPGYAHAELLAALSNIGRFLQFPELPVRAEKRKDRSIWVAIDADTLDREPIHHSASSRGALPTAFVAASRQCDACASGGNAESVLQTRQVAESKAHLREPAPVTIKFESVVINFNVAGLEW